MNIDRHLSLPLPFYDNIEKQYFRTAGCVRDFRTWILQTDMRHFHPFEVVSENVCSGDVSGTVTGAYIYDVDDTLMANLITEYDFITHIDTETDGDKTWLVYDRSNPFTVDLPEGMHYLVIDFCGQEYFSEVFQVCNDITCEPEEYITSLSNFGGFDTFSSAANTFQGTGVLSPALQTRPDTFSVEAGVDYTWILTLTTSTNATQFTVQIWSVALGNIHDGAVIAVPITGNGRYTGVLAATNSVNDAYLIVQFQGVNVQLAGTLSFYDPRDCELAGRLRFDYWHTCDLDDVLYQSGYRNRFHLMKKHDLTRPEYGVEKTLETVDGVEMVSKVVTNKKYIITFLAPQYMADAMIFMQMHSSIYLTTKTGETFRVQNINVTAVPENSCFYRIRAEVVADSLVSTACCNNFSLL